MKKKYLNLVSLFWFLKFVFDMFYTQKIFSIIITIFALLLLVFNFKNNKFKPNIADIFIIIMFILFSTSFFKSTYLYIDYLKIISAFILYFLGRLLFFNENKTEKTILFSLFTVFSINLIICLIGKGSITWGNANTLRGLYFFKTDFACMLCYFLVFWLFNYNKSKSVKLIITIIDILLILLTNARIYYLICIFILVLYYFFCKKQRVYSFKTISTLVLSIIIVIFGISLMSNLSFFKEREMISLSFNSFEDLFDASNTQGRNEVWNALIYNFNNQNLITRTFGTGLDFYIDHGFNGFSEHSTYIKVLLNTGYFGLTVFSLFMITALIAIKKIKSLKLEYIIFILLIIFLVSGISSPTILYINTSWLPMFYAGIAISNSYIEKNERIENL